MNSISSLRSNRAFTLVELIVVITILAVLWTVGFISLQGFSKSARDSERTTDLVNISKAFEIQLSKGVTLPQPDANMLTITASGATIGYQGYAGPKTLSMIGMGGKNQDPLDNQYYTYTTNLAQSKYQILGLLEDSGNPSLALNEIPGVETAYAAAYTTRYPLSKWASLGILIGTGTTLNQPIQESYNAGSFTGVDVVNTISTYSVLFASKDTLSGTGFTLGTPIQISFNNGWSGFGAPTKCSTGFIPIKGNNDPNINQPGFWVSKYAMTYADADTPDSTGWGVDWNTMAYVPAKTIVSLPKYPIVDITQLQAITACQSIGAGYHLITNAEWMTIARDIEDTSDNWSTGIVGSGGIYRGITNEANSAASLGCATADSTGVGPRAYAAKPLSTDTTKFATAKASDCDSKRQHKLSNGQIIWDMAGNVWEHVNKGNTIDGSLYNDANSWKSNICSGVNTWASFYNNDGVAACVYSNGYSYANQWPKITNLNASNGIGRIYSSTITNGVFLRGGDARAGPTAGVFSSHLGLSAFGAGQTLGFRCAR
jgi:prepilin-type N-terminal cleavage/methylation domain-containing protein